ncbi:hypothetical protein SUGI_0483530 [Cryptomeria japonica]|nr:hypothetical protein SUGI_0483530 [Cryptomeria japonica]
MSNRSFFCCGASVNAENGMKKPVVPALIIFGDSTVDPGNNNNILTVIKSNFPPYGRDFYDKKPTGRFSNGKIVTDYIASDLNIKDLLPAYLDPTTRNQDLITGVSFASAGTGYDNLTATILSVIPLWQQVEYFKVYQKKLRGLVGEENATHILSEAIYGISMGSNDWVNNYFVNPIRMEQYTVQQYQNFLIEIASNFIQEIYSLGARRIACIGIPPLGCLPSERTLRGGLYQHGCIDEFNEASQGFNQKLISLVENMKKELVGVKIAYGDIYSILLDIIQHPHIYGFDEVGDGCCGTGLIEVAILCNIRTPFTCINASEYVFWDSFHPTQNVNKIIAHDLLRRKLGDLL